MFIFTTIKINACKLKNNVEHFNMHDDNELLDLDVLYTEETPYQTISVFNLKDPFPLGKCLMLDTEVQLCEYDEHRYHEMIVHFPFRYLENLNVKNVLIIGGGDLMTLREVMKYPSIENVILIEIDASVIDTSVKYFEVNDFRDDPRVKIIINDAKKEINNMITNDYKFDAIIIDTTEDSNINARIDDLFFFERCKELLLHDGILIKNGSDYLHDLLSEVFPYTFRYNFPMKVFESAYSFILCSEKNLLSKQIDNNLEIFKTHIQPYIKYYDTSTHNKYINWHNILNIYDVANHIFESVENFQINEKNDDEDEEDDD